MRKNNENKKGAYAIALLGLILLIALIVKYMQPSMTYMSSHGIVWTTQYNITYESDRKFDDSIQTIFKAVDNSLSMFNKSSLISRINGGEELPVDSMLKILYNASVEVNKDTEGAFDPTVSPLMKAWGFVEKTGMLPDSAMIDSIREFVGMEKTCLDGGFIRKSDNRISFDFSAIAKGFACDEIGRMLERNSVKNYLVEIGGEIAVKGVNPSGVKWRISIDTPEESNDSVIHESAMIVSLDEGGIATSGNYRNYKDVEGIKVVHTMNPKTGYPEISRLLSATVIAENCMLADAYATACMAMGLEKSISLMKERKDMAVMLIYAAESDSLALWHNEKFKSVMSCYP